MQQIIQYLFSGIFLLWLFLIAYLLWRHALGGGSHIHRLHLILNENTKCSVESAKSAAEAAQKASEAALRAVESNHRLIVLLEAQQQEQRHDA